MYNFIQYNPGFESVNPFYYAMSLYILICMLINIFTHINKYIYTHK